MGDRGTPKLKLVSVKQSVSVKIGKSISVPGTGMLFLSEENSVSVCYLPYGIGIVKSFKSVRICIG